MGLMLKFIWIFLLLQSSLFSLEIDEKTTFYELLSHSEIYKDYNKSETISTIQKQKFKPNDKKILGCSYSPNYEVWIKFKLTNKSSHTIEKIIEYANPLTSYVDFYENNTLKKQDGLLHRAKERKSLNPILKIRLKPHQSKEFYIKASSTITTLIIKLKLWNPEAFYHKDTIDQLILALFFGAMGITILYNSIIFLSTREISYFYYVLFFISSSFHHLMYKGIGTIYLFSPETMHMLINNSSIIVAMPTIALALFTQHILKLEQYPRCNKILFILLLLYPIFIITIKISHLYQYRNWFFMIILVYLFIITAYALLKKNKSAPLIFLGWILFVSSGVFMQLSSVGSYTIFERFPYYVEFSLIVVILIFSWLLASKIKMLNHEKINGEKNALLLKELNHRVKNSMQTILSVLTLQKNEIEEKKIKEILSSLEKRIMATTELYSLLQTKDNITVVDIHQYFALIVNNIKESFNQKIVVNIQTDITMNSEYAIYLGLIVNEAVTNAFKYSNCQTIDISLTREKQHYQLIIKDDGEGFQPNSKKGLGLTIIDTLATLQLEGTLDINSSENGVKFNIEWSENEQ